MKKIVVLIFLLVLSLNFIWAQQIKNINFSATVEEPYIEIEILNDSIDLGTTTPGYRSDYKKISVITSGTADAYIQPVLSINGNSFFEFLEFSVDSYSSGYKKITENPRLLIAKPTLTNYKEETLRTIYTRLNLEDYDDELNSDIDIYSEVTFWIIP